MSENEGPYSYGCPKGILDALTPTTNEYALEWRQKCREQLEKKKAAAGRIPRDAKRLYITFLVNTSASKAGDSVTVEKINDEWIYIDKTGNRWRLLPSHIRNNDIIRIDKAENAEEAARTDAEEATKRRQEATTSPAIDPDAEKPTEGPSDAEKAQRGPTSPGSHTDTHGVTKSPYKAKYKAPPTYRARNHERRKMGILKNPVKCGAGSLKNDYCNSS